MDEQHKYLYSLFDRIEQSVEVSNQPRMKALIDEIERYLLFHFTSEEYLMRMYDYPSFAAHQSEHETAGARLVRFLDDFGANCLNPAALRIFLTGWLMEHSEICDSDYVKLVLGKRECVNA